MPVGDCALAAGGRWCKVVSRGINIGMYRLAFASLALMGVAVPALAAEPGVAVGPGEVVSQAPAGAWRPIAPSDLLVMELAPDASGRARRVVIQLMPAPFSAGWVGNIRKLAAAHFWDGTSVYRVQDNYVAQWGDAEGDDPKLARPLPSGLAKVPQEDYVAAAPGEITASGLPLVYQATPAEPSPTTFHGRPVFRGIHPWEYATFWHGWPISGEMNPHFSRAWPIHCYGSVGVARDLSPDTGTGAELYAVIGEAPRQLDRNIAVVGRVIEGMEFLSSLPRGPAPMGFYADKAQRVRIVSVRLGSEMADPPAFEYLDTEGAVFAAYVAARANRRDPFFIVPAGGVDVCNVPVPVRRLGK